MSLGPRLRKFVLTAHIVSSVGWLGGAIVFLALAVIALTSKDVQIARGVYLVMEPAGWFVLVPLSLASLLTGLVQSLGTTWGLLRHYWVLFKLLMNVVAPIVLLLYMQTLGYLADIAADPTPSREDLSILRSPSPAIHAGAALLVLLMAVTLSVYKPRGLTPYGLRKQLEQRNPRRVDNIPWGGMVWGSSAREGKPMDHSNTAGADLTRLAVSATVHCLTGCAIGEVLGMVIGTAMGWSDLATIALAVALAFLFGYALTIGPVLRSGLPLRAAIGVALAADTVSITVMEIVDNAIMVGIPGAMDAGLASWLFWSSLTIALAVAFVVTLPVNRWMIGRGKGHAAVHQYHESSTQPTSHARPRRSQGNRLVP